MAEEIVPLPDHKLYRAVPVSYDETLARLREIFWNHPSFLPLHSTGRRRLIERLPS